MKRHRPALILFVLLAAAAPKRELQLEAAPAPVQKAVRAEPGLSGMKIDALEVQEIDLDHDGHAEWLVVADATDATGLHPVNRPTWLFRQEAGTWRLVDFLGYQIKVEPIESVKKRPAWDDLWTMSKDGVRQRCMLLGWGGTHYSGKAVSCTR